MNQKEEKSKKSSDESNENDEIYFPESDSNIAKNDFYDDYNKKISQQNNSSSFFEGEFGGKKQTIKLKFQKNTNYGDNNINNQNINLFEFEKLKNELIESKKKIESLQEEIVKLKKVIERFNKILEKHPELQEEMEREEIINEESNLNNKDIIVDNNVKIKKDKKASPNDK